MGPQPEGGLNLGGAVGGLLNQFWAKKGPLAKVFFSRGFHGSDLVGEKVLLVNFFGGAGGAGGNPFV